MRAETLAAISAGEVPTGGEIGLTPHEQFPQRYAAAQATRTAQAVASSSLAVPASVANKRC